MMCLVFISLLLLHRTLANLLLGGTPTCLDTWPTLYVSSINDGNIGCDSWYHSNFLAADTTIPNWASVQMTTSSTVNTILFLAGEHCCPLRNVNLVFRVGAVHNPLTNPVCVSSPIQYSGWY